MTRRQTPETRVLIVGAGPVGLTLAMDLAWRGIDVIVAETRHAGQPPSVKSNHVSARSMEIFRRLGFVKEVRDAGLPCDFPNDVSYRTTTTGLELSRIRIPSRRERYTATDGCDSGWPTPEPPHRINQIYLEPVLFRHAASSARIRILTRTRIERFRQEEDRVVATARDLETGETYAIACEWLVGCDGGPSETRRQMGARFTGDAVIQRVQSTYIWAAGLIPSLQAPAAWGMFSLNPRRCGVVYAIDGREKWLIHNYLDDDETDFDAVDRDASIRAILGVDESFRYETLGREDWFGRRLLADRFRRGRVFICGDAAHIWVPFAGYGMNAGIADAANLSWLLAAHLNGWADAGILDAYEAERWPITEQVSHFAMRHARAVSEQRRNVPPDIEAPGPEGDAIRAAVGQAAYELNVQQYCAAGLNFGYYYDSSPIIAYDAGRHPAYTMGTFTPSTVPGCRVPHVWLRDGRSLYDALGREYTLLVLRRGADVAPLTAAARSRGVPLEVLEVTSDGADDYDHDLVLSRPDQHIAWRGNSVPQDPDHLLDVITGRTLNTAPASRP